jgi:hypothetical protein
MAYERSQVSVRLDPALRAALEHAAERERRTVSNMVRYFVEQGIESSERREPAEAAQC